MQIQLSPINWGEWKIAPEYKKYQITEDKFYQMNRKQRLKSITRFNNIQVKAPKYDGSIGNKNCTNTDTNKITITADLAALCTQR